MTGYGKKKQYLSTEAIDAGIAEVAEMVRQAKIGAALVGGCALQQYGSDRLTADIDFASTRALSALPPLVALSFGGYQSVTPSGIPVDWIVRADDYAALYEEAVEFAVRMDAVPIKVATPEYLAAMKMVARRKKDDADLDALLQSGLVNVKKARSIIKRLLGTYAADDFDSYVMESKWRKKAGR